MEALKKIEDKGERDSLLFDLVMKFCLDEHQNYSDNDGELLGDILARLLQSLDTSKKIEIADQIAVCDVVPVKVVRYLALEPIEIAEAVLTHSPVLTDNDLLVVIRIRGFGHMIAISSRENLSAKVSSELVKYGDETVWVSLVENTGAKISPKTFHQLSGYVKNSEVVLVTLLSRSDIPEYILRKIVIDAGEAARPFLMSGGLMHLAAILDDKIERQTRKKQMHPSLDDLRAITQKLRQGKPNKKLSERDFLSIIEEGDFNKIVCVFSHITGIPLKNALELFSKHQFEPAILAFRARGIQRDTLEAFLNAQPWKLILAPENRRHFLTVYDKLKPATARGVFNMRLKLYAAQC
ncbi:MAG: DUF2336 domain-containing protein [Hyphomicrobiales bacterium]